MAELAQIGDYDIRDKKLADAGTSTTVASADAVMLKSTNGEYVEIDRDSFADAIRVALGPILTNMTQKSAASGGVLVNDSNDVGTITPANLASILSAAGSPWQGTDCTVITPLKTWAHDARGNFPTTSGDIFRIGKALFDFSVNGELRIRVVGNDNFGWKKVKFE